MNNIYRLREYYKYMYIHTCMYLFLPSVAANHQQPFNLNLNHSCCNRTVVHGDLYKSVLPSYCKEQFPYISIYRYIEIHVQESFFVSTGTGILCEFVSSINVVQQVPKCCTDIFVSKHTQTFDDLNLNHVHRWDTYYQVPVLHCFSEAAGCLTGFEGVQPKTPRLCCPLLGHYNTKVPTSSFQLGKQIYRQAAAYGDSLLSNRLLNRSDKRGTLDLPALVAAALICHRHTPPS